MNQAQEEYLERFCAHKNISKEEAQQYDIVKGVLQQLENYRPPIRERQGG